MKGNAADGVAVYSPQNTIGPGNLISGNLRGVLISGATATGNLVYDNLIGTDSGGTLDLGNLAEGILIQDATDNVVRGDAKGSQVISGNLVGIAIAGASATRNVVIGNLIGSDRSGLNPLPNAQEGVKIAGSPGNTIGGNLAAAQNLISANHWGVRIDGAGATGNLVAGNYIGTDITGIAPLGNEVNGVIISTSPRGTRSAGSRRMSGNRIAFNAQAGVTVRVGDREQHPVQHHLLQRPPRHRPRRAGRPASGVTPNQSGVRVGPNDLQNYPVLTSVTSNGTVTHIVGTLNSLPGATFLIQFFASKAADPSGYGEGERRFYSTQVTTDASGNAVIDVTLPAPWTFGLRPERDGDQPGHRRHLRVLQDDP